LTYYPPVCNITWLGWRRVHNIAQQLRRDAPYPLGAYCEAKLLLRSERSDLRVRGSYSATSSREPRSLCVRFCTTTALFRCCRLPAASFRSESNTMAQRFWYQGARSYCVHCPQRLGCGVSERIRRQWVTAAPEPPKLRKRFVLAAIG
jgi:hypothetical protein